MVVPAENTLFWWSQLREYPLLVVPQCKKITLFGGPTVQNHLFWWSSIGQKNTLLVVLHRAKPPFWSIFLVPWEGKIPDFGPFSGPWEGKTTDFGPFSGPLGWKVPYIWHPWGGIPVIAAEQWLASAIQARVRACQTLLMTDSADTAARHRTKSVHQATMTICGR